MNVIDERARPYLTAMIQGQSVALDVLAQQAIAAWMAKVAVTARSASPNPLPIDKVWTDWLYKTHQAPPDWVVSIGRYDGDKPFWYRADDVHVQALPEALNSGSEMMFDNHGVLAFLILGYLAIQIFGTTHTRLKRVGRSEEGMIDIWPTTGNVAWPPGEHFIDDAGVPLWVARYVNTGEG